MNAQDLLELLRTRPFTPFRIFANDGRTYDVCHPDQALVLRSRVILPLRPDAIEVPERSEHLALIHIVRLEELPQGGAPSAASLEPSP
jgi:hypothetical protein